MKATLSVYLHFKGGVLGPSSDPQEKRTDDKLEPFTFWGMPHQWFGELIPMFYAKLIVDLSPSDGKFLTAALSNRVGYIGACFTEAHCDALMARARIAVIDLMKDPSSKLYSPSFAKA